MKLKLLLFAGAAVATLTGATIMPAAADDYYTSGGQRVYDDQADETRALNLQALESAKAQNGSSMTDPGDNDNAEPQGDGRGGPEFQGPPGPNDMGMEPGDENDQAGPPDDEDAPDDQDAPDDGQPAPR